jgi:hypothetical protein
MTNRLDPYYTGPATDPAAEPTPTELLAWLRGREAVVDRRLDAHREGMLRALDVKLEPVTKQLSKLQLQADATDRHLDQHVMDPDQPHSAPSYYNNPVTAELRSQVDMLKRRLDGHVGYHAAHNTTGIELRLEEHVRSTNPHPHAREVVDETVHEGIGGGEEPDGVLAGPTGDGQSDLTMVKYAMHLGNAHGVFARVAADPDVTREQFDIAVHEYREQVFEFTRRMRIIVASREGQGAQVT